MGKIPLNHGETKKLSNVISELKGKTQTFFVQQKGSKPQKINPLVLYGTAYLKFLKKESGSGIRIKHAPDNNTCILNIFNTSRKPIETHCYKNDGEKHPIKVPAPRIVKTPNVIYKVSVCKDCEQRLPLTILQEGKTIVKDIYPDKIIDGEWRVMLSKKQE